MVNLTYAMRNELQAGNLDDFGSILHENWMLKKTLADGITTPEIDDWYAEGLKAGAHGGKLLGAGSGGFLMFHAPVDRHDAIERAVGLRRIKFNFDPLGSRILFYHPA